MAKKPNKPAHAATQTEINRVAVISQQELTETSAFATVNPRTIPEVKVWLRVDQATSDVNGISSIPDELGGPSATQSVNAQKPVLGTTSINSLPKMATTSNTALVLPVSAAINNTSWFAMGLWVKPSSIAVNGSDDFINMTVAAGCNANRLSYRQTTDDMVSFIWDVDNSSTRQAITTTTKAFFAVGVWKFVCVEFDGSQATENLRHRFKDMGSKVAAPNTEVYSNGNGTLFSPPGPSSLVSVTGNAMLFNRNNTFNRGFAGDVGPDIFFYDPRTITQEKLIQLAQFRVPVG